VSSDQSAGGLAAVDYYFLDEEGGSFKATVQFDPYFLLSYKVRTKYIDKGKILTLGWSCNRGGGVSAKKA
jgi:hypothetical protein